VGTPSAPGSGRHSGGGGDRRYEEEPPADRWYR
jgi:hypothetical protein